MAQGSRPAPATAGGWGAEAGGGGDGAAGGSGAAAGASVIASCSVPTEGADFRPPWTRSVRERPMGFRFPSPSMGM